jgi:hypothetical protein
MALNQEDVLTIISMIEKRGQEVLEANNISDQNDPQYLWISGIYNDITEYLKSQF